MGTEFMLQLGRVLRSRNNDERIKRIKRSHSKTEKSVSMHSKNKRKLTLTWYRTHFSQK